MPPLASIIMRSKNEMPHAEAALAMLDRQTFRDFELFAVDSGSTDGSLDLLRTRCDAAHLERIAAADYRPGRVLNGAIGRTASPIVVLLNADAVPLDENWLDALLRPLRAGEADAVFSRQRARPDARFIVAYDHARAFDPRSFKGDNADFFSAAACAFRRELWERHPFRPDGYAEDAAWAAACRRDGARIAIAPSSEVEHSHNYSMMELFRKKRRHGATFAEVLGQRPSLFRQAFRCGRELLRDFGYALLKGRPATIPYNIAYRIVVHAGLYRGMKEGRP